MKTGLISLLPLRITNFEPRILPAIPQMAEGIASGKYTLPAIKKVINAVILEVKLTILVFPLATIKS